MSATKAARGLKKKANTPDPIPTHTGRSRPPPMSNFLYGEFPELRSVQPTQISRIRSDQAQPYLDRKPKLRNPFLTTPTPADTPFEPNATLLKTWSNTMVSSNGSPSGKSGSSPNSTYPPSTSYNNSSANNTGGEKKKLQKSHNNTTTTTDGSSSPGRQGRLVSVLADQEALLATAKKRGLPPPPPTTGSFLGPIVPPSMNPYQLAHQQSCELCNQNAIKHYVGLERKIRNIEHDQRFSLQQEELQGRRELYKEYAPAHTRYRSMVDTMLAEKQRVWTVKDLQRQIIAVEQHEVKARDSLEIENLRMLRALRRCCFRVGWELQAKLDEISAEEYEKVRQIEVAEAKARAEEEDRIAKVTQGLLRQLAEHEVRMRREEESYEFRAFVKLLLKHKEGMERAQIEANKRLDQLLGAERLALEQTMLKKRIKLDEEEREARNAVKLRHLKQLGVLKQKPITQKLMDLPAREESARAAKLEVLAEELMFISLNITEHSEELSRKHIIELHQRSLSQVMAEGVTLAHIEFEEDLKRREIMQAAELWYEKFIWEEVSPTTVADELVCKLLFTYE